MDKLAVGILAHVDAGKTTLSEAMLYACGQLKKLGRVDHRDAFLDTETLERERGITIFSKLAILPLENMELTLLDTPGHVDFSSEMERTLRVLDCAILVVSGSDGVQGHTETLWRLLKRYGVPTFVFINKMDLHCPGREVLLHELRSRFDGGCVDFSVENDAFFESVALCDEGALERYMDAGRLGEREISALIGARKLFPCCFGSALKLEGVDAFLAALARYAPRPKYGAEFGARVYKIARDPQGARLTYLKVTGGSLRVKTILAGEGWEEKADQLRVYSGAKFRAVDEAAAGTVCAVTGLTRTFPGQGLGFEEESSAPMLEPVLTYKVILPEGCDPHVALNKLGALEEEDPQLHLAWSAQLREIHIQLMGEVQLEILKRLVVERFGMEVEFGSGSIVYKETIAGMVEGVGHYEPLRHYAEVHLVMTPGPRGSGVRVSTTCPDQVLERTWQRLILSHVLEKSHLGVLTGSPLTDVKITLAAGRAHLKHTEGGDFRQATYRAIRQGLMQAQSVLLEPWYDFKLDVPAELVGRAMSDVQRMHGDCHPPETTGDRVTVAGSAPVSAMRGYAVEVAAYTGGRGRLFCTLRGYEPCYNQGEVLAALSYDPERDTENTPDSVFCAHGAGFNVKWDRVGEYMHMESVLKPPREAEEPAAPVRRPVSYTVGVEQDKELQAIYERTYGPVKRRDFQPTSTVRHKELPDKVAVNLGERGEEYLLVDGYNIIFAWDELKDAARESLDGARVLLMDLLSNYRGFQSGQVILVFDAYKVKGNPGSVEHYHDIHVVYTKEAETADAYIERATYELSKKRNRVRVATSDGAEQMIILGHGALRVSARAFHEEVEQVVGQISNLLRRNNQRVLSQPVRAAMEKARGE